MATNIEANQISPPGDPGMTSHGGCRTKKILMLVAGVALLLLAACTGTSTTPPATDMAPVGDGLKIVGFAVLGAAVVTVLGRLLK